MGDRELALPPPPISCAGTARWPGGSKLVDRMRRVRNLKRELFSKFMKFNSFKNAILRRMKDIQFIILYYLQYVLL